MFRNLEAEQARKGFTNSDVAEKLGISRVSYESKKNLGNLLLLKLKPCASFSNVSLTIFSRQKKIQSKSHYGMGLDSPEETQCNQAR